MFILLAQRMDQGFKLNDTAIFWGAIVLICCIPSIAYYLYRWRKTELEAELKRDMIAQGMSADEIERVLNARMSSPGDDARSRRELKETRMHPENRNG
jgi:hypothetical protein